MTLGSRGLEDGFNHMSETASGVMGIWGHNAVRHPTTNNAVRNTRTSWYSHFMRIYYDHGISFHTSASTLSVDDSTVWDNASPSTATSKERVRITTTGEFQVWGDSGTPNNRIKLSYNSTSGVATFGPHSTGGSTSLSIGTSVSGTYAEKLNLSSAGILTSKAPQGTANFSTSSTTATIANNGTVSFPYFSGMILVNNQNSGSVTAYVLGGGSITELGSSNSSEKGSWSYDSSTISYVWTNNTGVSRVVSFMSFKTRNYA